MKPYFEEDGITIYHGDCREILPTVGDGAIVSDPPYGMAWDGKVTRSRLSELKRGGKFGTSAGPTRNYGATIFGDDAPFDPAFMLPYGEVILWGFNHFPQHLSRGTALVWLKRYDDGFGSFLSDAEIAWMKGGHGVYCKRDVSLQGESSQRAHPTQKPIDLMQWCIGFVKAETILDPFMGSGSTLVAAKNLGRKAIGIEIEERYCEIAAKRLAQRVLAF
jgi:DNA modification methylase